MGLLLVLGGVGFIIFLITFFVLLFDKDFSPGLLAAMLFFAIIAFTGGIAEHRASKSCVITTKEYKAFRIERINVSCEKPMLIRRTFYNYPNYSIFYDDRSEYEILGIEK